MEDLLKFLADRQFSVKPTFDGVFQRFGRLGGSDQNPNGWFVGREVEVDGQPIRVAHFGDWRTDEKYTWTSLEGKQLTPEEAARVKEALTRADQANRKARDDRAVRVAKSVNERFPNCIAMGEAPYLVRKGVGGSLYGCKLDSQDPTLLVIPLRDVDGALWSVQMIYPDGDKRYLPGGRKKGLFHQIEKAADGPAEIYICEGIATAASVHLATKATVLMALDAGNLLAVATSVRARFPEASIVLAADNDLWKKDPAGNVINAGLKSARKAVQAVKGRLAYPIFASHDGEPTDFNDLHVREGLDRVRAQLAEAPPPTGAVQNDQSAASNGQKAPKAPPIPDGPGEAGPGPLAAISQEEGLKEFGPRAWRDAAGNRRLPTEQELATAALEVYGDRLVKQHRELFVYDGVFWRRLEDDDLDRIKTGMQLMCGGHAKLKLIREAFGFFMMEAGTVPAGVDLFAPVPNAANFKNGTLWLRRDRASFEYSLEFCKHQRENYLLNVLPYDYDPDDRSENEMLTEMLGRVFAGERDEVEKLRAVAQMYGACLMPTFARLFLLWGQPQTGKSTLINLAAKLVSAENIASVPPSEFHGFNMESLAGKLINIDTDLPTREPMNDAIVKKIIERKPFRIRRKGVKDLMAPIPAVHIFGGNEIPPSYEASTAHERRWTFLHCNNVIEASKAQNGHTDYWDIVYGRNPQGLLNFALTGLRDLVANRGHFTSPESSAESMKEWHREANPVAQFLHVIEQGEEVQANTRLIFHANARIKQNQLWEIFEGWAEQGSLRISWLSKYKFYSALRKKGFRSVTIEGYDHFAGIGTEVPEGSQF